LRKADLAGAHLQGASLASDDGAIEVLERDQIELPLQRMSV